MDDYIISNASLLRIITIGYNTSRNTYSSSGDKYRRLLISKEGYIISKEVMENMQVTLRLHKELPEFKGYKTSYRIYMESKGKVLGYVYVNSVVFIHINIDDLCYRCCSK